MILQQTLKVQVIMHYCFKALNLCIVNPVVPVSVHSDSANGNILLLTNIVYVINKKKNIVISTHLSFAIIFRLDMSVNSPC